MRRPADRRRAPGLRARPRPAAYGVHARRSSRRWSSPSSTSWTSPLEEPVGRPRRRGARPRPGARQGAHPAHACWRRWPTPSAASSWPSRPSTRPATAGWSSGASSSCSASSGGTGPGSPVRVMSFSLIALQRMQRLAPELERGDAGREGAPLADAAAGGRDDWIIGPGIDELREHPGLGRHLVARVARCTCGPSTPRRTSSCASTSASPRSSPTGPATCSSSSTDAAAGDVG